MGDILLAFPALGPVARATGAGLFVVTRAPYAPLVERHPDIAGVVALPAAGEPGGVAAAVNFINDQIQPDFLLDWHGVPTSRYLAAYVNAEIKITYQKYAFRRWLLATTGLDLLPKPMSRVTERYVATARRWRARAPDWSFRLAVDGDKAESFRRALGIPAGGVALVPGAKHAAKAWPADYWVDLGRALARDGLPVVLFGDEGERELCARVAAAVPGAVNVAGRLALADLPEALAGARLCVTNDSAFAHLAPLVDVPALVLFGPTTPRFGFAPWGPRDRVLYLGLPCSPCSKHGRRPCWRVRRYCMEDLRPGEVVAAAREMLAA